MPARDVGETEQVVAGGEDGRGVVLDRQLHLPFAAGDVAGTGRDDDAVEPSVQRFVEHERAVVGAVRPRVQHDVTGADALHVQRACAEQRADLAIPLRVEGRSRLARGTAGHEHAHRLARRVRGRHALVVAPRGVVLDAAADVVDRVGRRAPQVVEGADRGRVEARLGPATSEERHLRRSERASAQALQLRALDRFGRCQPRGLEVLGRRRVEPRDRCGVSRLERPAEGAHETGR